MTVSKRLLGKVAVITGGSGGIGAATGKLFAQEGAQVLLVDREEAALKAAVMGCEMPGKVEFAVCDVTQEAQVRAAFKKAVEKFGGVDIVFNNAGTEGKVAPLDTLTETEFMQPILVNVTGAWLVLKHAVPELKKRGGGAVLITSSVAGQRGAAGLAPYVTSKHAVLGLARSAALELAPFNIRVNTIHPGPIANRMMESIEKQAAPDAPAAVRKGFEARVPLGRYGSNEDVASLALFLASDASAYLTGSAYNVDGGFTAG